MDELSFDLVSDPTEHMAYSMVEDFHFLEVDFSDTTIKDKEFISGTFRRCNLTNTRFENCTFAFISFHACKLEGTGFNRCEMIESGFDTMPTMRRLNTDGG